jgi:hypothetical protein
MSILKNTTEGIYPFQQALYDKVKDGGFKRGEMFLISAGRQTGKSMLNQMYGKLWNNNLCKEILLPMKPEPKYKFSREWYIAEFDWVHTGEVLEWCKQQFGPHPKNPDAWSRWVNKYGEKIHFRDEKDYAWFMLRWS